MSGSSLDEITAQPVFHLALPVLDLAASRAFYADLLNCRVGREKDSWIDFNFFGYQLTVHKVAAMPPPAGISLVDGVEIPVPHFGLILGWDDWHRAVDHLNYIGVEYRVPPQIRFRGEPGEQATFFITDPSGNVLEFKSFQEPAAVFRQG